MLRKRRYIQKNKLAPNNEIEGWLNKYGVDFKKTMYEEHTK